MLLLALSPVDYLTFFWLVEVYTYVEEEARRSLKEMSLPQER